MKKIVIHIAFFYTIAAITNMNGSLLKDLEKSYIGQTFLLKDTPWTVESRIPFKQHTCIGEQITLVHNTHLCSIIAYQTRNIITITKAGNKCTARQELVTHTTPAGKVIIGGITFATACTLKMLYTLSKEQ
jgi:hypothetical protein